MSTSAARVPWTHRLAPFAAIGTTPAALMLGGGVVEQFPAGALLALPFGVFLILLFTVLQGRRGQRTGRAVYEIAIEAFGPGFSRLASLLVTVLMVGWFAFQVGVGGTALAQILGLPAPLGVVLYAVGVAALVQGGIRRWNWVGLLSIGGTVGFVLWSLLLLTPPTDPALPALTSFPAAFAGASLVLGYAAAFALRSPDFTRDLQGESHVLWAALLGLGLPLLLTSSVGVYLYLGFGTWDLPQLLVAAGLPLAASLLLVLGFVGSSMANLYSARLSTAHLVGWPDRAALLSALLVGTAVAATGFYQSMILWLTLLGVVVPPLIATLILSGASPRLPWVPLVAWAMGTAAGLTGWVLGTPYYLLLGILPPLLLLGVPWNRLQARTPRAGRESRYRGIVTAGRGLGAKGMSAPGMAPVLRRLLQFDFVPGTLNVRLGKPFDGPLEDYVAWEALGRPIHDPEVPGRRGLRYGRVLIAHRFPGIVFQGDEPDYPADLVELVSDHHLRETLGLDDGDSIEFTLVGAGEGTRVDEAR